MARYAERLTVVLAGLWLLLALYPLLVPVATDYALPLLSSLLAVVAAALLVRAGRPAAARLAWLAMLSIWLVYWLVYVLTFPYSQLPLSVLLLTLLLALNAETRRWLLWAQLAGGVVYSGLWVWFSGQSLVALDLLLLVWAVLVVFWLLRAEQQRALTREAEVVQQAQQAVALAQAANEAKDRFTRKLDHEARTPLGPIRGGLYWMNEPQATGWTLNEAERLYLDLAQKSTERLIKLVESVLDMATLDDDESIPFKVDVIELRLLFSEFQQTYTIQAQEKGLYGLELAVAANTPDIVQTDETRLVQILTNVLSNAIKYTSTGGRILMVLDAPSTDAWRFTVSDSGIGLSEGDRERVFERDWQAQVTEAPTGAGIGLAVTANLVKRMGGHIMVSSTLGIGSVFSVELPRVLHV